MTLRGRDLLAAADVVVLDRIARDDVVLEHARPDVEIIDAGHGEQGQELTHAVRAKLVVKAAKSVAPGGLVVRLMDGDPATFNGLVEEVRACRKAGITYDVVPGVSALTAGPTYAGVPADVEVHRRRPRRRRRPLRARLLRLRAPTPTPSCSSAAPRASVARSPRCALPDVRRTRSWR